MKMSKKLKITVKIINNVAFNYLDTRIYIKEDIYFVWCLLVFEFFEQIDVLPFYALAILFLESK